MLSELHVKVVVDPCSWRKQSMLPLYTAISRQLIGMYGVGKCAQVMCLLVWDSGAHHEPGILSLCMASCSVFTDVATDAC